MKTLTSKFLAVALLVSVAAPMFAEGDTWGQTFANAYTAAKARASEAGTAVKGGLCKAYERTLKPYEYDEEGPAKFRAAHSDFFEKPEIELTFMDRAKLLLPAYYNNVTTLHPNIANAVYYPALLVGLAGVGYLSYKGYQKAQSWWKSRLLRKLEEQKLANLEALKAEMVAIKAGQDAKLADKFNALGLKDDVLLSHVNTFDGAIEKGFLIEGQDKKDLQGTALDGLGYVLDALILEQQDKLKAKQVEAPAPKNASEAASVSNSEDVKAKLIALLH